MSDTALKKDHKTPERLMPAVQDKKNQKNKMGNARSEKRTFLTYGTLSVMCQLTKH
jgi:hypothetical protein